MLIRHWLESLRASWFRKFLRSVRKAKRRSPSYQRASAEVLESRAAPSDSLGTLIGSSLLAGAGMNLLSADSNKANQDPLEISSRLAQSNSNNIRPPKTYLANALGAGEAGWSNEQSIGWGFSNNAESANQPTPAGDSRPNQPSRVPAQPASQVPQNLGGRALDDLLSSALHEPLPQESTPHLPRSQPSETSGTPLPKAEASPSSRGGNPGTPPGGLSAGTGGQTGRADPAGNVGSLGSNELAGTGSPGEGRGATPALPNTNPPATNPGEGGQETNPSPTDIVIPASRSHGTIQPLRVPKPPGLVQIRATDDSAYEGRDTGEFTIRRTHAGGELTVTYEVSGTATFGKDYQRLTGSVTLAAGQRRETIEIDPIDDLIPDSGETVTLTLTSVSDANYVIDDEHQTDTVTISNSESGGGVWVDFHDIDDDSADEGTSNNGAFSINRHGTSGSLTVGYILLTNATERAGNAKEGDDYVSLGAHEVHFVSGVNRVEVIIDPIDDSLPEGDEKVVLLLTNVSDSSYKIDVHNDMKTIWIYDDESSGSGGTNYITVDSYGTDSAYENSQGSGGSGEFWFTRSDSGGGSVTIDFTLYGNAIEGNDYISLGTREVTIAANENSAFISIDPIDNFVHEFEENVILVITEIDNSNYEIGRYSDIATVWISDDDVASGAVWIETKAATTTEGSSTPAEFLIRRDTIGETLVVNYSVSGDADEGTDYVSLGSPRSVMFGINDYWVPLLITSTEDLIDEDNEDVEIELTSVSDTDYWIDTTLDTASVDIIDNDDAVVTVAVYDAVAKEAGQNPGSFRVTRNSNKPENLLVHYTVSGTANTQSVSNPDHNLLATGSVTISAGSAFADVPFTPVDDSFAESNETVKLTLSYDASYGYSLGTQSLATIEIVDNDSTVSVSVSDTSAHEELQDQGTFTISRIGDDSKDLWVDYSIGGTATASEGTNPDHNLPAIGGSVLISAGQSSATVTFTPQDDNFVEQNETVILTIQPNINYIVDSQANSANATIADNEATITIAAGNDADEEGEVSSTFTFTRSGYLGKELVVTFGVHQDSTADPGDYQWTSGGPTTVTFLSGEPVAYGIVKPVDDSEYEGTETLKLEVLAGTGYQPGSTNTAQIDLLDNDSPVVSVTASDDESHEHGTTTGTFVFTRTGYDGNPLTVTYDVVPPFDPTKAATLGNDYTGISATTTTVTFAAFQSTKEVVVTAVDDGHAEPTEIIKIQLVDDVDYDLGPTQTQTSEITIVDNDIVVSVDVTEDPSAHEEGLNQAIFTVTRSDDNTESLTVHYTIQGTATTSDNPNSDHNLPAQGGSVIIPAGEWSVSIDLIPVNDNTVEALEDVVLTLIADPNPNDTYTVHASNNNAVATIADNDANITIAASEIDEILESELGSATFTLTRTGFLGKTLDVSVNLTGSATINTDYTLSPSFQDTVNFGVNEVTKTITVTALEDSDQEPMETVVATVDAGTDYQVEASPGNAATIQIIDNDTVVQVEAEDALAHEHGQETGKFRITRSGNTTQALKVYFTLGGDAVSPNDYDESGFQIDNEYAVIIPANQTSRTIFLTPENDTDREGVETVILSLDPHGTYIVADQPDHEAMISIIDNDTRIHVEAIDASAHEENQDQGEFKIIREGNTDQSLVVHYQISGQATMDDHDLPLEGYVTIAAGELFEVISLTPTDDNEVEENEIVTLTIVHQANEPQTYTIETSQSSADVIIQDNEATITIAANAPGKAYEAGETQATFTLTREGYLGKILDVSVDVTGAAVLGDDYNFPQGFELPVRFLANEETVQITIIPVDDDIPEPTEKIQIEIINGSGYEAGDPSSAEIQIVDNDTKLSVAASDPDAHESNSETGTFTITREGDYSEELVVSFSTTGEATVSPLSGADHNLEQVGEVTILAGQTTATVTVTPVDDAVAEPMETVILTLDEQNTYTVVSPETATVNIIDNDTEVWVEAADPSAHEHGENPGYFLVQRDYSVGELTVYFTASGQALADADYFPLPEKVTFDDEQSEVIVWVKPYDDSVENEGEEQVILTLTPNAAYAIDPSQNADAVTIYDDESSGGAVRIEATDNFADEFFNPDPDTGELTITRSSASSGLFVQFSLGGTATEGNDYESFMSYEVEFEVGEYEATLPITPLTDAVSEGNETVVVTLTGVSDSAYEIETTANADTVTIADDESPSGSTIVNIEASKPKAYESGSERQRQAEFTFSRDITDDDLTVYFTVSGTATEGDDYNSLGTLEVKFLKNQSDVILPITAIDDLTPNENAETIILTLAAGGYTLGSSTSNTATIYESGVDSDQSKNADSYTECGCKDAIEPSLSTGQLVVNALSFLAFRSPFFFPTYSSNENPHPIVQLDVHLPDSDLPDHYAVTFDFGGIVRTLDVDVPATWTGGEVARLGLQADASTLPTGRYDYTVTLTPQHSDGQGGFTAGTPMTHTGGHEVFNRRESAYGNRWWIPAIEELQVGSGGASLIRGDGTAAWYESDGSGGYLSPYGAYSTLTAEADGTYTVHVPLEGQRKTFEANGRLTTITDDNGNATSFSYVDGDGDGQAREVSQITNPAGQTFSYTYSGGQLASVTDFEGRQFDLTYDTEGRVTSITAPDPDGTGGQSPAVINMSYDSTTSLLTSLTDPENNTTTFDYGSDLRLEEITHPGSITESYDSVQSQALDELILISEATGTTTSAEGSIGTVQTDGYGYVTEYTDALGNVTTTERNEHGRATQITNALGESVSYAYDDVGRLLSSTYEDGTSESWTYDAEKPEFQAPRTYVDRLNHAWHFRYDEAGNLLAETDPLGQVTYYTYDSQGMVTSITQPDPDGTGPLAAPVTQFEYNTQGRLTKETFADNTTREYTYDTNGNLTSEMNELGHVTSYAYDALGRMIELTLPDPDGAGPLLAPIAYFAYDKMGRLVSETDPLGNVTNYTYNALGQIVLLTLPDPDGTGPATAPTLAYTYDDDGNLLSETDPLGNLTSSVYDLNGNVSSVTLPDPDGAGPLAASTITYVYDDLNRVSSETDPLGNVTSYTYDDNGNLATVTDDLGRVTSYAYDANGNLLTLTLPDPDGAGEALAPVLTYTYDSLGNLLTETDPLGNTASYGYDTLYRQTSVTLPDPGGWGSDLTTLYEFDSVGNLVSETNSQGHETTYVYDAAARLIQINHPHPDSYGGSGGSGGEPGPIYQYEYDNLGRLIAEIDPLDHTTSYAYDANGNLTATTDALGRVTSFEYDNLNRQTSITRPDPDGAGSQTAPVTSFTFDAAGNLLTQTDPLGNTTTYVYDNLGQVLSITQPDPDGAGPLAAAMLVYEYDALGQLVSQTDPLGHVTSYVYDEVGNLTQVTLPDPDGSGGASAPVYSYAYDDLNRMVTETDPLGNTTGYRYDAAGQLIAQTDRLGHTTDYEYDALGRRIRMTLPTPDGSDTSSGGATGPSWYYYYDELGRLTDIEDPVGGYTSYGYDSLGRTVWIADPGGNWTDYSYDDAGRRTGSTDSLGYETSFTFDDVGNLLTITQPDPDGSGGSSAPVTSFVYDELDRLISVTDPLSHSTSYVYDSQGNLLSETNPLGHATLYAYDNLSRLVSVTDPDPDGGGSQTAAVTQFEYDALGRQTVIIDPLGQQTTTAFDNLGRVISVTDPESGVTSYTYDAVGNRTSLTDPVGNTTDWTYDAEGRVLSETNELNDARVFEYDAIGRLAERTDRLGRIREFDRDDLGRVIEERWLASDGVTLVNTITWGYNGNSQITAANDTDSALTFSYDSLGQLTQVDNTDTANLPDVVLDYTYDPLGRRTQTDVTVEGQFSFSNTSAYDAAGNLIRLEQSDGSGGSSVADKRVDLTYDALGRFQTITRFEDLAGTELVATTDYTFDPANRLTALDHEDPSSTTLADYGYSYDTAGRIIAMTTPDGSATYSYDDTSQLLGADYDFQTDENHTYDANGNRANTGYTIGTNNQLLSDGTFNYEYDAEGNRTKKTEIATGDYTSLEWDHQNHLVAIRSYTSTNTLTQEIEYDYDALGRRIAKRVDETGNGTFDRAEKYVYDSSGKTDPATGVLLDDVVLVFDISDQLTERYLHGPAIDQVFASEDAMGEILWSLGDHQGTIRDVVDYDASTDTTSIANHRQFDAFGNVTSETNSSVNFFYSYTGRVYDADAGLYYYRARWYDAATGRFMSEDPIGFSAGDANLGRYVGNGVINATDPSGLDDPELAKVDKSLKWYYSMQETVSEKLDKFPGPFDPKYALLSEKEKNRYQYLYKCYSNVNAQIWKLEIEKERILTSRGIGPTPIRFNLNGKSHHILHSGSPQRPVEDLKKQDPNRIAAKSLVRVEFNHADVAHPWHKKELSKKEYGKMYGKIFVTVTPVSNKYEGSDSCPPKVAKIVIKLTTTIYLDVAKIERDGLSLQGVYAHEQMHVRAYQQFARRLREYYENIVFEMLDEDCNFELNRRKIIKLEEMFNETIVNFKAGQRIHAQTDPFLYRSFDIHTVAHPEAALTPKAGKTDYVPYLDLLPGVSPEPDK